MVDSDAEVNKKRTESRSYDSSLRREKAARTRDAIIDAAKARFLADGYGATTVANIAADVGVSDHTIYKSFRGKPGLIEAIRTRALEGDEPVPAEQRSDDIQSSEPDPRKILQAWGTLTAEVAPKVAPILLLIRDAVRIDAEVEGLHQELDADRLRRMTDNARRLQDNGHLRHGVTLTQAADVLWTYSSPELYELLVVRRKWPTDQYGHFVGQALIAALL
jgi:AcrR family transcriptional regulator